MSTIDDYYAARADVAPFAAGDADILHDITFSDYANASAFTTANPDFAVNGANVVWASDGIQVGATSSVSTTAAAIETALLAAGEGTFYFEVERQAITTNEGDVAGNFIQSSARGGVQTTTTDYLIGTTSGTTNYIKLYRMAGTTGSGAFRLNVRANGGTAQNIDFFINSQRDFGMTDDEYTYARIMVTWKGRTVTVILDGLPVVTTTLDNDFAATAFNRITVGNQALTSAGHFGPYSIRRLQISKRQSLLVANPTRIAFLGDSFMLAFNDSSDYTKLSDLTQLCNGTGRAGYKSGLHSLLRAFSADHNMVLTSVKAATSCENGSGFSSSGGNQIDATQWNAVINHNPEILITAGSTNDINTSSPAPDIYGDTKTILDTIIDGCGALREIHFFGQFPGYKGSTTTNNSANIAEYKRLYNLQKPLNGYTRANKAGETCKVYFHETYDLWGGDDYSVELSQGSATGNTISANADIHPSSLGHIKMAEIMYHYLEGYLTRPPMINS